MTTVLKGKTWPNQRVAPDECIEAPETQKGSQENLRALGFLAERVGFEPTVPCGTPDFESGTIDHSATSPDSVPLVN